MNRVTRNDPQDAWMAEVLRCRADDPGPRSNCPQPERIWDAVRLRVPLYERLEIIDHLSVCPTCAEAWSLAATLEPKDEHTPQLQVISSLRLSALSGTSARLVGAAAVLFIALGIGFIVFRQTTRQTDIVAGVSQPRATATPERPSGDQQSAALPETDFTLRWTPGPAGSRYDVTVMTADKRVVAEAKNLQVTEYQLPSKMRIELAAMAERVGVTNDAVLFWRVVARTPEGSSISSDLLPVTLRGKAPPVALADQADEAEIRRLVGTYRAMVERGDIETLRAINPGLSEAELVALQKDLLGFDLGRLRILIEGRSATAFLVRSVRPGKTNFSSVLAFRFKKTDAGNWVAAMATPN